MSASLKARIARLEQRQTRRLAPRLVFKVHGQHDGEISGFAAGKLRVIRSARESAADCAARAFKLQPSAVFIAAIYATSPRSAVEREEAMQRSLVAPDTPTAPVDWETDPYALAGIGREATRKEMEHMGAMRVAPERLI